MTLPGELLPGETSRWKFLRGKLRALLSPVNQGVPSCPAEKASRRFRRAIIFFSISPGQGDAARLQWCSWRTHHAPFLPWPLSAYRPASGHASPGPSASSHTRIALAGDGGRGPIPPRRPSLARGELPLPASPVANRLSPRNLCAVGHARLLPGLGHRALAGDGRA